VSIPSEPSAPGQFSYATLIADRDILSVREPGDKASVGVSDLRYVATVIMTRGDHLGCGQSALVDFLSVAAVAEKEYFTPQRDVLP
jgi:hypothetical protein